MNLPVNGPGKPAGGMNETEMEVKRYLRMLNKRKWMIAIVTLLVFVLWTIYVILYQSWPIYTSTAILQFQDERDLGSLTRDRVYNSSKAQLLETNRLLGQVVEHFQINLSVAVPGVSKGKIFPYRVVDRESRPGTYKMKRTASGFDLFYTDVDERVKNKQLGSFTAVDTVRLNNFSLKVDLDYWDSFSLKEIEFVILRFEQSVKAVRRMISYSLDRTQTMLMISATHSSPYIAANAANVLSRLFVEENLRIKQRKTNQQLAHLEDQMAIAEQELNDANQQLQTFRERNPWVAPAGVGLGGGISRIATYEANKNSNQAKIEAINGLLANLAAATDTDKKVDVTRELLIYLVSDGVLIASNYQSALGTLTAERNALLARFPPSNPQVVDNQQKFLPIVQKVESAARDHVLKMASQSESIDATIRQEKQLLQRLPRKERELAEMMIYKQVKSDLYESILGRVNTLRVSNQVEVNDVFLLDEATVPPPQERQGLIIKKSMLGLFLGLGMGIGLAIVLEFFDKTVQNSDDLENRLKVPVLGSIPIINDDNEVPDNIKDIKGKRDTKLITLDYSPTLESESYRDLRTKLLFMNQNQNLSSLLITSLRPGEGKSLTASNLSITFAQQKISTLLIDADLRRGVLHNVYGNKKKPGLSDFLISKATVDYDNVNKLIQKTFIPNLYLITTGSPIPNPTEMLGSERMVNLLNVLKSRFGMVILDTAPFEASSDAPILSGHVGGCLIIVRAGYTNVDNLQRKLNEYPNVQRNLLGFVLNMVKVDMKKQRYQYSYYNY